MDSQLRERLLKLEAQITKLRDAEASYLTLEAHKKVLAAQLFLKASGKNVSEREANVYASKDWIVFSAGHVQAETEYNEQRRRYELLLKAYDAAHLTLKTESAAIQRQVV